MRAIVTVLDSFGVGSLPDAQNYGDAGSNTLLSCVKAGARLENLARMGLFDINGCEEAKKIARAAGGGRSAFMQERPRYRRARIPQRVIGR